MGSFCLDTLAVSQVVYLGGDDAFDRAVSEWATRIAGPPDLQAFWSRSLACLEAGPEQVAAMVEAERRLFSLRHLETLSSNSQSQVTLGPFQVLLCHQKVPLPLGTNTAQPSLVMVSGADEQPSPKDPSAPFDGQDTPGVLAHLAPGSLDHAGLLVLEASERDVRAVWYDRTCKRLHARVVPLAEGLAHRAAAS